MTELLLCFTLFVAEMLLLMEMDQFQPRENKNFRREVTLPNALQYSKGTHSTPLVFILVSYSQSNSKSPNFQENNILNVGIYFFFIHLSVVYRGAFNSTLSNARAVLV